MRVYQGKSVDQSLQHPVHLLFPLALLPHPAQEVLLVAPVAEDQKVIVASQNRQELLENLFLLASLVGPEGVATLRTTLVDDHADEIVKFIVRAPLNVDVDVHGFGEKLRRPVYIDLLVPYREGLKGVVVLVAPRLGPFPPPHGPERMGEVLDCQDAIPRIASDFFLPHPPQEADVILLDRLLQAALTELADLAMVVQDQPRR